MNKEKVTRILNEFDRMFPDAACELVHDNELELLIAVMLSAQTTDASVNKLTKTLFQISYSRGLCSCTNRTIRK